jgi:hypothetical protein
MRPLLYDILQEVRHLTGTLAARVSTDTPGVPAGVSRRTPLLVERGKSVHWNLHLFAGPRARIKARTKARGL